jgi:transposase-like protein
MDGQTRKPHGVYPKQLKIQIAMEVITGMKGVAEASRDYNIESHSVSRWVKRFRSDVLMKQTREMVSSQPMETEDPFRKDADLAKQVKALEEENTQLRKKLVESKLKAEALNTLIDLADENYGLSLRKNSGAKQSSE